MKFSKSWKVFALLAATHFCLYPHLSLAQHWSDVVINGVPVIVQDRPIMQPKFYGQSIGQITTVLSGPYGSGFSYLVNGATPATMYTEIYSGGSPYDAMVAGIVTPAGASQYQTDAVNGSNLCLSSTTNCVAHFGLTIGGVAGSNIWGGNWVAFDRVGSPFRAAIAGEFDLQPSNPLSAYSCPFGVELCGLGIQVSMYSVAANIMGTAYVSLRGENQNSSWYTSFGSANGSAYKGLHLGAQSATAASSDGQLIQLDSLATIGGVVTTQTAFIYNLAAHNSLKFSPPSTHGTGVKTDGASEFDGNVVLTGGNVYATSGSVFAGTLTASPAGTNQSGLFIVPTDDTSSTKALYVSNHANSAYVAWINDDGSATLKGLTLSSLSVSNKLPLCDTGGVVYTGTNTGGTLGCP